MGQRLPAVPDIQLVLKREPGFGRRAQDGGEPNGRVRRDAGVAVNDARQMLAAQPGGLGKRGDRDAVRLQEPLGEDLAGRRGAAGDRSGI